MTELLHWSLEHSEPAKIKELMEKYQAQNLTITDVYGKDVLDALLADEGSIIKDMIAAIGSFTNASMPDEYLENALESLRDLVDQIDNGGNLHRMGGLAPLLDLALGSTRPPHTRASALWTLGVALQNNPPVQQDVLSLDGMRRLGQSLPPCGTASADASYCAKLLYVISGLIKNNSTLQVMADSVGVYDWLLDSGLAHADLAIAKKAMSLIETVLAQTPESPLLQKLPARQGPAAEALLGLVRGRADWANDLDASEKALRLVNRVLAARPLLFAPSFRSDLAAASAAMVQRCKSAELDGELCEELADLARQADAILAAQDVADAEL